MANRTQDSYSLSQFRQNPDEHLERIANGSAETITQNGKAAMVVMSPETYDAMKIALERGHLWDESLSRLGENRGVDARQAIEETAKKPGLSL